MRLAIWQAPSRPDEPADHEERLGRLAARAAEARAAGADLLMLPEMYLGGYDIGAAAIAERAEPRDGPAALAIADIARRENIAILYGYAESADGAIYNAVQCIDPDGGALAHYRKTQLFGDIDREAFSAGDELEPVFRYRGRSIGLLICYDVEFPELVRRHALAGADTVLVPTALMEPYDFVADTLVPTRAWENSVFLAYANRSGAERSLRYLGRSCIIAPDGVELSRAGRDETLLVASLDPRHLEEAQKINTYLADRRPALSRALTEEQDRA